MVKSLQQFRKEYPDYDDMSDEQLSRALYNKAYSDMPYETFTDMISYYPNADTSAGRTGLDQTLQGTVPFADEIQSGIGAAYAKIGGAEQSIPELYGMAQEDAQKRLAAQQQEHPVAAPIAQVAAGIATAGIGLGSKAGQKAIDWTRTGGLGARAAKSGALSAPVGAAFGAGYAQEGHRIDGLAEGAVLGALGGAGVSGATSALPLAKAGASKLPPSINRFSKQADNVADTSGQTEMQQFISQYVSKNEAKRALQLNEATKNKTGVDLPPAATINNPQFNTYAKTLAQNPETADIAARGIRQVGKQVDNAEGRLVNSISDVENTAIGASRMQEGANNIRNSIIDTRKKQASPLYATAFNNSGAPKLAPQRQMDVLENTKAYKSYANSVASNPKFETMPTNSLEFMNEVRSQILSDVRKMQGGTERAGLQALQARVLKVIDNNIGKEGAEAYKKARSIYSDSASMLDKMDKSAIGKVIKAVEEDASKGVNAIMNGDPTYIKRTKQMFEKYGQGDNFNAGVKSYVQSKLANAAESRSNLLSVFGKNQIQRERVMAALGKEEARGMRHILGTLEKQRRLKKLAGGGSDTQPKQQAQQNLNEAFQTSTGKKVQKAAAPLKAYSKLRGAISEPATELQALSGKFTDAKALEELTEYMFTPKGNEQLRLIANAPVAERAQLTASYLASVQQHQLNQAQGVQ